MDLIRWKANERVGLLDLDALSDLVLEDQIRNNREREVPVSLAPQIISGFSITGYTLGVSSTATLNYGAAIMKLQKDGVLSHGFCIGFQSPASYLLDFSAAGNDTYAVYVRAVYADGDNENRVFWNPGTAAEYVDFTSTRRRVTWESTYQSNAAASPGPEWLKIYEVTVAATIITAVTDKRNLYWEGNPFGSYDHEWGDGTNDRNADRATYGVRNRWTWDQAVRRQIADIIGHATPTQWWFEAPINLEDLNLEHYSEADSATHKGKHKTVTFGTLPNFWQLSSALANGFGVVGLNQPDGALLAYLADSVAGTSKEIWAPRGAGAGLTVGDYFRREVGNAATPDLVDLVLKNAANDYTRQVALGGNVLIETRGGSAVATPYTELAGEARAGDGFRLGSPTNTQILQVPIQMLNDQASGAWGYDKAGGAATAGRLTVPSAASFVYTSAELVLPHNAILQAIRILWAQATAGSGTQAGMRLYAQKHRAALTTVGQVGGGTGNPTTFVNLALAAQYIEHSLSAGGCASPYRRVEEFTCDASDANRTFDMTQDKLVLTLEAPDDAGGIVCSVYWIMLYYVLDWISPPLI